jgi:hypothetical protein
MMEPSHEDDGGRGIYKLVEREENQYIPTPEVKDSDGINLIQERQLVKKLDRRIMPTLFAMIVLK